MHGADVSLLVALEDEARQIALDTLAAAFADTNASETNKEEIESATPLDFDGDFIALDVLRRSLK